MARSIVKTRHWGWIFLFLVSLLNKLFKHISLVIWTLLRPEMYCGIIQILLLVTGHKVCCAAPLKIFAMRSIVMQLAFLIALILGGRMAGGQSGATIVTYR